jgi:hypothetical protein
MKTRLGGCLCGAVRYEVDGNPLRVGLCHCADCRKVTGSAFVYFAVWPIDAFRSTGHTRVFAGRCFCPNCGSQVFSIDDQEAEIRAGSLDDPPADLLPLYEIWIQRRAPWLSPIAGADQHKGDAFPPPVFESKQDA